MKNQSLMEQPEHKHYSACHARMLQIKSLSVRMLVYSFLSGIYLFVKAMNGNTLPFLTFVSKLMNGEFVAMHLIDIAAVIAIFALTVLGYMKNYLCDVIVFVVYVLMSLFGLFTLHDVTAVFIFLVSVGGAVVSFGAIGAYQDYKQLYETEGFPLFCEYLGRHDDHPEYVPTKEVYRGVQSNMDDIPVVSAQNNANGYMDDLPSVGGINLNKGTANKVIDFTEVSDTLSNTGRINLRK